MMGAIITHRKDIDVRLERTIMALELCVAEDAIALVLRGLRSLPARLERIDRSARRLASELENCEAVRRVNHPALSSHRTQGRWLADFSGAGGCFSLELGMDARAVIERLRPLRFLQAGVVRRAALRFGMVKLHCYA